MTTIVYREGVLAADTAVFDRGCYVGETQKIFRLDDGTLFGVAGAIGDLVRFRDWMQAGQPKDAPPDFNEDDSEAIVIRPEGAVHWHGKTSNAKIMGEYFAVGSGFSIAMGALAMGATAERAVEICADLDQLTRRPIIVLER